MFQKIFVTQTSGGRHLLCSVSTTKHSKLWCLNPYLLSSMYNPHVGSSTSKAYDKNSPNQSGSHDKLLNNDSTIPTKMC